jgi:hypothetical protein
VVGDNTSLFDEKQLPQVLKEACSHFNNRERDVFLIASITVLSG